MPHPLALFSLEPRNERASQVVAHPCNSHLVSISNDGTPVLDVGQVQSASGDNATLATIGRSGDILVDGSSISKIQCSFEIDRNTNMVLFHDKSHGQTSQVFGDNAVPFEDGRLRRVVVHMQLNTIIGMGGSGRNLILFELEWHCRPDKITEKVRERQSCRLQSNPRLARTADPTPVETRIHTPGSRLPKMRWQQIGESLGAGQFGTVYQAIDLDTGRTMAAKILTRPRGPEGDRLWVVLRREVEILVRISHIHVIDYIFSQGWEDGRAEIFIGLKEGTLASLVLGRCAVPERELANTVFHHMLQALDFLSVHGIIHRDLKPENILYISHRNGYHFQLGDFGVSNHQAMAATLGAGTPLYMAPEVYIGGSQTSKADIWSLFVTILWTMNAGGFREISRNFLVYDHVKTTVLSLGNIPELSRAREMARVDPTTRASAAQMLTRCFNGEGLTTPRGQIPPIINA
ncbi:kinase-like protein [Trichocladium antarcticum]|uniref:non-specific serine/threonine protein kinase n=1 Tax=Trichocladium antarcticum TaxID=1450529 RepID=A0AAN6UL26_9PEZI|nr:kinase-like protein [Trichocladium antarcticum]